MREVEKIYLHGVWLGVGGNTPWGLSDEITSIAIEQPDPRNFKGADSAFIRITFSDGYVIQLKTSDYMVYYKEKTRDQPLTRPRAQKNTLHGHYTTKGDFYT